MRYCSSFPRDLEITYRPRCYCLGGQALSYGSTKGFLYYVVFGSLDELSLNVYFNFYIVPLIKQKLDIFCQVGVWNRLPEYKQKLDSRKWDGTVILLIHSECLLQYTQALRNSRTVLEPWTSAVSSQRSCPNSGLFQTWHSTNN